METETFFQYFYITPYTTTVYIRSALDNSRAYVPNILSSDGTAKIEMIKTHYRTPRETKQ
jgi:hypothetical protein